MEDKGMSVKEPFKGLEHCLTSARLKHGLREENYLRYRLYCTRRLRMMRKELKFTNKHKCVSGRKAEFTRREITPEMLATDRRYFELVLLEADRDWAYGMELRQKCESEGQLSRTKFYMRRKMKRAVKWSGLLKKLCNKSEEVDDHIKKEADSYHEFTRGTLYFAQGKNDEAMAMYKRSRAVCDFSSIGIGK